MSGQREGLLKFVGEALIPLWSTNAPETEMERLMQNGTRSSRESLLPLATVMLDAFDEVLTDDEQWLLNAWIFEGLSLAEIGELISVPKPTIHRWKDAALAKLRDAVQDHPTVITYLKRGEESE